MHTNMAADKKPWPRSIWNNRAISKLENYETQHFFIDLTQRPPRSFRVRLGNYVVFGTHAGQGPGDSREENGEYIYNFNNRPAPGEISWLRSQRLVEKMATGKSDGESSNGLRPIPRLRALAWEIGPWSAFMEKRGLGGDAETLAIFAEKLGRLSKTREDVKTLFEFGELR